MKLSFGHVQVGNLQFGDWSQRWTIVCKGRYDNKYAKEGTMVICIRLVWGTMEGQKYPEWLILESIKQLFLFKNQNIGLG